MDGLSDTFSGEWISPEVEGYHLDLRELNEFDPKVEKDLRSMYDAADNLDMHDALAPDNSHQHISEAIGDESPRHSKVRRRLSKCPSPYSMPWSFKPHNIFLLVINFLMLGVYSGSDFLASVPLGVCYFIMLIHIAAIGLFVLDTLTHFSKSNRLCKNTPMHIV